MSRSPRATLCLCYAAALLLGGGGCKSSLVSKTAPEPSSRALDSGRLAPELRLTDQEPEPARRNWTLYPAIVQLDSGTDIYAIGDIHGDYDRLVALLSRHGILLALPAAPEEARWGAGDAVLVITGDTIDKGSDSLKVLRLILALRDSAQSAGGRVILTLGNHEAEFLANPGAAKVADFAAELRAAGIQPADVAAGRNLLGQYLRSLPAAVKIRDWFFCHAGHTAGRTLAELSAQIESGVDQLGYGAPILSESTSLLEARIEPTPWWEDGGDPQANLTQAASALGGRHIVMGHQPGKYRFSDGSIRKKGTLYAHLGVLFFIDVGMSRGVDYSAGALLRIQTRGSQTSATALYADGSMSLIWQG